MPLFISRLYIINEKRLKKSPKVLKFGIKFMLTSLPQQWRHQQAFIKFSSSPGLLKVRGPLYSKATHKSLRACSKIGGLSKKRSWSITIQNFYVNDLPNAFQNNNCSTAFYERQHIWMYNQQLSTAKHSSF